MPAGRASWVAGPASPLVAPRPGARIRYTAKNATLTRTRKAVAQSTPRFTPGKLGGNLKSQISNHPPLINPMDQSSDRRWLIGDLARRAPAAIQTFNLQSEFNRPRQTTDD